MKFGRLCLALGVSLVSVAILKIADAPLPVMIICGVAINLGIIYFE